MKRFLFFTILSLVSLGAQERGNGIPLEDRARTRAQALDVFNAIRAAEFQAQDLVFSVFSGQTHLVYGISMGEERLLTKASEVLHLKDLYVLNQESRALPARVVGLYADADLAILEVSGLAAAPAQWANAASLDDGAFLMAIRPDGDAQAIGVLSVKERSLKEGDQGFLGIEIDPSELGMGVKVARVQPRSAAAEVGIRAGDIITMVDGEEVKGFYELSTRLRRMREGERPKISLQRANQNFQVTPTLKGRIIEKRDIERSNRIQRMERMSGSQSRVRGEFDGVIQSDMELESFDAGLPVVDLEGRMVGMVIARAGRISTLILPGEDISQLIKTEASPYDPAFRRIGPGRGLRQREAQREVQEIQQAQREQELIRRLIEGFRFHFGR